MSLLDLFLRPPLPSKRMVIRKTTEKRRQQMHEHYLANKANYAERSKQWFKDNPEKAREAFRNNERRRRARIKHNQI